MTERQRRESARNAATLRWSAKMPGNDMAGMTAKRKGRHPKRANVSKLPDTRIVAQTETAA